MLSVFLQRHSPLCHTQFPTVRFDSSIEKTVSVSAVPVSGCLVVFLSFGKAVEANQSI